MKYLHVFASDENNKFSLSYTNFIKKNFAIEDHIIALINSISTVEYDKEIKIITINKGINSLINLIRVLYKSDKIIIHGLFSWYFILILFFQPWILKKCYWCIWGGDLYLYKYRKGGLISECIEFMRKFIIKNIHGLITQLKGDYELAKKWYSARGAYYYSFMYPSNLYKEYDLKKVKKVISKTYIQVGNSACETNNHIEVFEKLSKYKDQNIEIICPLSYSGKEEYIKEVIEVGYKIFGKEKFSPITDFMPFDKYLEMLAKIDVAIFNHKRQRGLGNITTLLGLGKKIYIREEISTWSFCIDHDFKVYGINSDFDNLFEKMDEKIKKKNIDNMKLNFSEEKLVEDWKRIFNEGEGK